MRTTDSEGELRPRAFHARQDHGRERRGARCRTHQARGTPRAFCRGSGRRCRPQRPCQSRRRSGMTVGPQASPASSSHAPAIIRPTPAPTARPTSTDPFLSESGRRCRTRRTASASMVRWPSRSSVSADAVRARILALTYSQLSVGHPENRVADLEPGVESGRTTSRAPARRHGSAGRRGENRPRSAKTTRRLKLNVVSMMPLLGERRYSAHAHA